MLANWKACSIGSNTIDSVTLALVLLKELQGKLAGSERRPKSGKENTMFMILFVVLVVMWLLGFAAFHVAGGMIHLLLIIAVISLVMHLVRGRSAV